MTDIMQRIKTEAERQGLTQVEIARRVGVTTAAVHHWMNGNRPPTYSHLCNLADAVGLEMVVKLRKK